MKVLNFQLDNFMVARDLILSGILRTGSYSVSLVQMILSAVYIVSPVDIIPEGILLACTFN